MTGHGVSDLVILQFDDGPRFLFSVMSWVNAPHGVTGGSSSTRVKQNFGDARHASMASPGLNR